MARSEDIKEKLKLAETLYCEKRYNEAKQLFEKILAKNQNDSTVLNYLGVISTIEKDYENAINVFDKALQIEPLSINVLVNLAIAYYSNSNFEKSLDCYLKAIELEPRNYHTHFNLAVAYQEIGEIEKAILSYSKVIELDSTNADAKFNIGMLQLLLENFSDGWKNYEFRSETNELTKRTFTGKKWIGEDLSQKILYVYPDQGYGDTIQFIRYLPVIRERVKRIIIECQTPLVSLLMNCKGFDTIVETPENLIPVEEYDYHISYASLPFICLTDGKNIPTSIPYLFSQKYLIDKWKNSFDKIKNLKVGITWRGNPKYRKNNIRSATLEAFSTILDVKGITFISLQKDRTAEECELLQKYGVIDLSEDLSNFNVTSSVIENLDIIISTDTSVPHLSGALGIRTWLLLSYVPDWRWLLNKEDSHWYPSMKLFRQESLNNWEPVFEKVKENLLTLVQNKNGIESIVDEKQLTLALSKGKNFGWGVCSEYLRKETPKYYENVQTWDYEKDTSTEQKVDGIVFHALTGLDFLPISKIWGDDNYGYTFFENELNAVSVLNAERFKKVIGGSTWNKEKILQKGITNTDVLVQGIDPTMFYPIESDKNDELFVIFSGGKFELRKGQDLVLKAVKILQEKYDDIILINAWYNLWPQSMELFNYSKHISFEILGDKWQDIMNHIYAINEIDPNKMITLELVENFKLRNIYSKTDIGLFPNRCEGGTNLVLMEYMACGKPVIASYSSGHKDVLDNNHALLLEENTPFKLFTNENELWADWEEASLDEIISKLEFAYNNRDEIKQLGKNAGEYMKNFTWEKSAESLIKIITE